MTLDSILTWFSDPTHLYLLGCIAGQLVLALPDSPFKTYATNVLHGLFASPQVFANGAPKLTKPAGQLTAPSSVGYTSLAAKPGDSPFASPVNLTIASAPGILDK